MILRPEPVLGPEIAALLAHHHAFTSAESPPESRHALDLDGLRQADVTVCVAWEGSDSDAALMGIGALKALAPDHGEVKSMHTAEMFRGRGVAAAILGWVVDEARRRAYRRLSLETGSMAAFAPARALYARHGFVPCAPFGPYREDPNSAFMTLKLA